MKEKMKMSELKSQNKFMFYENFFLAIEKLPEDKRAKACYEFCKYGITGELPKDENIAMFCIGVSASVQKYQGRGGFREGSGRKSKKSKESKKSKKSYDTNINININRNRNINLNNNLKTETEDMFNEFWSLYVPVKCKDGRYTDKGSKQVAFKSFCKALEKDSFENIKNGLERYLRMKASSNSMTANVSTFLNQERWKDEFEENFIIPEKQEVKSNFQQTKEMMNRLMKEDWS